MEKISDMRLSVEGDRVAMRWTEKNNGWVMTAAETAELIEFLRGGLAEISATSAPTAPLAEAPKAVAWMTHHDEPMLFPTREEAETYCDDDEEPIPLYLGAPLPAQEALERDAGRYRWLMDNCGFEPRGLVTELRFVFDEDVRPQYFYQLEIAIDAALQHTKGQR